jgi:hypothetical protein
MASPMTAAAAAQSGPRTRFPEVRFAATHPMLEPSAVIPHAGICAGPARTGGPYRDSRLPCAHFQAADMTHRIFKLGG